MTRVHFVHVIPLGDSAQGGGAWVEARVLELLGQEYDEVVTHLVAGAPGLPPLHIRGDRAAMARTALRSLALGEPLGIAKFRQDKAWSAVVDAIAGIPREAPIVTSHWVCLDAAWQAGREVSAHVAHNVEWQLSQLDEGLGNRILGGAKRARDYELRLLRHPREVLAISRSDASYFQRQGIDARHLRLLRPPATHQIRRGGSVGMLGRMEWAPNARDATTLLQDVLPALKLALGEETPRIVIAGSGSESLDASPHVAGVGPVGDAAAFLSSLDLLLCPRFEEVNGISVKLVEAIEQGVMAVAPTRLVADLGLDREEAQSAGVLIAETPAEMAQVISAHYRHPPAARPIVAGSELPPLIIQTPSGEPSACRERSRWRELRRVLRGVRDRVTPTQRQLIESVEQRVPGRILSVNLQTLGSLLRTQEGLRSVMTARQVCADGWPVVLALRSLGLPCRRVTGADFVNDLVSRPGTLRMAALGSSPAVQEAFAVRAATMGHQLVLSRTDHISAWDAETLAGEIRAAEADLVLVMGFQREADAFADELSRRCPELTTFQVGAALDFLAGVQSRAPKTWQRLGLEWAWRLLHSPGRLWRRYLVDAGPLMLTAVVPLVLRSKVRKWMRR